MTVHRLGKRSVARIVSQSAGLTLAGIFAAVSGGDSGVIVGRLEPGALTVPRSLCFKRAASLSPSASCEGNYLPVLQNTRKKAKNRRFHGIRKKLAPVDYNGAKRENPMAIRYLKVVFVALVSLLCLFYAGQNVANLDSCYQAFAYVLGGVDHQIYPRSFFPSIQSGALVWLVLAVVVSLEFLGGLLAAKGAWDLWTARKAPAATFNSRKTFALLGCGVGIFVWLGLFAVFGGALFQMWQTEIGEGSLADAFQFFSACAFVFLIVNSTDE